MDTTGDFKKFVCEVGNEQVMTYDDLIRKIRNSNSDNLGIKFTRNDEYARGGVITCNLNCVDGANGRNGAQITLKNIEKNDKNFWSLKKRGYNYPDEKSNIVSIETALYQILSKKEVYKSGQAITSIIFMLADAARSSPCEEIAKKINSFEYNKELECTKYDNYSVGDGNQNQNCYSLKEYLNNYDKCYRYMYNESPSKIKPEKRKILYVVDYELYFLNDKFKGDKNRISHLDRLKNTVCKIEDHISNVSRFKNDEEKGKCFKEGNEYLNFLELRDEETYNTIKKEFDMMEKKVCSSDRVL